MGGATSKDGKFLYNGTVYNTFEEAENKLYEDNGTQNRTEYSFDGQPYNSDRAAAEAANLQRIKDGGLNGYGYHLPTQYEDTIGYSNDAAQYSFNATVPSNDSATQFPGSTSQQTYAYSFINYLKDMGVFTTTQPGVALTPGVSFEDSIPGFGNNSGGS